MTNEHDSPPSQDGATPGRKAWSTPVLTVLAADAAAADSSFVGSDGTLYS